MTPPTQPTAASSRPSWEELGRYLAGESSPSEAESIRRWIETHPSDADVIAALDRATKGVSTGRAIDVEAALRNVKTRAKAPAPSRFARFSGGLETYAAAAAILLVAGLYLVRSVSHVGTVKGVIPPASTFQTQVGKRDSVLLSDGTRILIGPSSQVVVQGRTVDLRGEAYFSVAPHPGQPFTVHAGETTIRDIGTEFSVHNDASQSVRVVVSEGIVMLSRGTDSVRLEERDVGVASKSGLQFSHKAATPEDLAWTQGRLVFRDAPIEELAADLRRWYGVELRVSSNDSALLKRHFTGSFTNESASRVLDVISLALGARVDRQGDTATLRTAPRGK
jgi:transmembrane sensor